MSGNEHVIVTRLKIQIFAPDNGEAQLIEPDIERVIVAAVISADMRRVYCARSDDTVLLQSSIVADAINAPEKFSVTFPGNPAAPPIVHWYDYHFTLALLDENDAALRGFIAHALHNYARVVEQFALDQMTYTAFDERTLRAARAARDVLARWNAQHD